MTAKAGKTNPAVTRLTEIMTTLRSPKGCPWDREQTTDSLKPWIIDEAYELVEAIDSGNHEEIKDELGDLLLQVVFISEIHREQQLFDLEAVAENINAKMIRRHPHVFGDADPADVHRNWEIIKQQERSKSGRSDKLADRIASSLPALKRATKTIQKCARPEPDESIDSIIAELQQLKSAIKDQQAPSKQHSEVIARLLFSMTQLSASLKVDAEEVLRKKTAEIIATFDKENYPNSSEQS